ncbi:hypothetical protein SNEBB_008783 [Seison nebaliae]|nr:hypothetical protein SNEBB_008783 [Seison nebaliae]
MKLFRFLFIISMAILVVRTHSKLMDASNDALQARMMEYKQKMNSMLKSNINPSYPRFYGDRRSKRFEGTNIETLFEFTAD